jgi:hypothetical protein
MREDSYSSVAAADSLCMPGMVCMIPFSSQRLIDGFPATLAAQRLRTVVSLKWRTPGG